MPIRFLPAPGAAARWRYTILESPIGPLLLAGTDDGLGRLSFADGSRAFEPEPTWKHEPASFLHEREQLNAYFAGELTTFDVDLAPRATPFQRAVLEVLATIPHGETRSYGEVARLIGRYGEVARLIGRPGASRAVGAANGANPIPVILPCHRVVGADGSLTGFGGGLPRKRFLLDLERRQHELFTGA